MPRLLVNPGTPHQWEIPLKPGANTLGRSSACDGQVDHESVSGTHCQVMVNGEAVSVKDLGSTNGTFLNRAPIQEAPLAAGQRLQLGGVEMELIADPPRTAAGPVAVRIARPVVTSTTASAPPAASSSAVAAAAIIPAASTSATTPAASVSTTAPVAPRLSVRLAAHEPTPPPPPTPAPYVPDEYSAELSGPAMCKYHPKSTATYLCPQCQLHYCDLCVTSRPGGQRTSHFCRRCDTECVALNVQIVFPSSRERGFFSALPGAFLFPFKGSGVFFLIGGALLYSLVVFFGGVRFYRFWYARVGVIGYTFAYLQKIIHGTAQGDASPSGWPDISEFVGDLLVPCGQLTVLVAACFGPAIGILVWAGFDAVNSGTMDPQLAILSIVFAVVGAGYFPMAFLAVAMFDSVISANPLVVIPAMLKVPLEYLAVLVIVGLTMVFYVGGAILLPMIMPVPILPTLVINFALFYFLTVQVRVLGLMYYAKRDKLGWFRH